MEKDFTDEAFLRKYIQLSGQSMEPDYIEKPNGSADEHHRKTAEAYIFNLAKIYMDSGQPNKALPLLEKLYANNPSSSQYVFHLAMCYQLLKQFPKGQNKEVKTSKPGIAAVDAEWLEAVECVFNSHHSDSRFNLDFAADKLNLSKRQFNRRIKQLTGLTPNQYLREIRLQRAKDLLIEGKFATVKEVAFAVGFLDVRYFSALFEKHFGVKPSGLF